MPLFLKRRITMALDPSSDPLSLAIAPPPDESPEEREARLTAQAEAQKRSDAIDEEINRQRLEIKRTPKSVRVLLLGQSESGKSTTLKNFQLINSPKAFREERASWRAVVQLNVVRSVRLILEAISTAHATASGLPLPPQPVGFPPRRIIVDEFAHGDDDDSSAAATNRGNHTSGPWPKPTPRAVPQDILKLRMRLLPLQQIEETLLRKLSPGGGNEYEATQLSTPKARGFREVAINSAAPWKGRFRNLLSSARASMESGADIDFDDPNDPGVVLHACAEDIIALWKDDRVKTILVQQGVRIQDQSGFYLDSIERVTALRYVPTDDDILRARLKTLGVSEHKFKLKAGNVLSHDWTVYDVGGARSLRAAWAPYFDNLDAIIFLAPISGFNEVLLEDNTVNKLEDSTLLWKHVVSNPLLKHTQIVLFLNKIDLFKAKLDAGVRFGHYVVSYGDRPNEYEPTAAYIRKKFGHLFRVHSSEQRTFYSHLTSMTDIQSTHHILMNVKDMVIRSMLEESNLV